MTSYPYPEPGQSPAWDRYITRTHAIRDQYLATTAAAHHEYLTGMFPDRSSYVAVEVSAWTTYHAAMRATWQAYTAETAAGTPDVYRTPTDAVTALWEALGAGHGALCPECGVKWREPSPDCPKRTYDVHPQPEPHLASRAPGCDCTTDPPGDRQPVFTPANGG